MAVVWSISIVLIIVSLLKGRVGSNIIFTLV